MAVASWLPLPCGNLGVGMAGRPRPSGHQSCPSLGPVGPRGVTPTLSKSRETRGSQCWGCPSRCLLSFLCLHVRVCSALGARGPALGKGELWGARTQASSPAGAPCLHRSCEASTLGSQPPCPELPAGHIQPSIQRGPHCSGAPEVRGQHPRGWVGQALPSLWSRSMLVASLVLNRPPTPPDRLWGSQLALKGQLARGPT